MMNTLAPVQQAMTKEEWAEFVAPKRWHGDRVEGRTLFVVSDCGGEPYGEDVELDAHETAAKCLHGQPFGFTHEDVAQARAFLALWDNVWDCMSMDERPDLAVFGEWVSSMADRIAALLPPEEP